MNHENTESLSTDNFVAAVFMFVTQMVIIFLSYILIKCFADFILYNDWNFNISKETIREGFSGGNVSIASYVAMLIPVYFIMGIFGNITLFVTFDVNHPVTLLEIALINFIFIAIMSYNWVEPGANELLNETQNAKSYVKSFTFFTIIFIGIPVNILFACSFNLLFNRFLTKRIEYNHVN